MAKRRKSAFIHQLRVWLTQLWTAADVLPAMRRVGACLIPVLVVVFATTAAGSAKEHHEATYACPPAYARVLRSDRAAVVYTIHHKRRFEPYETPAALATNACAYGSDRAYRLGESVETYGVLAPAKIPMALTGSVLAYEDYESTEARQEPRSGTISWQVVVVGLRTGRVLHRVPTGVSPASRLVGDGELEALVVNGDGAVAWIVDTVTEDIKSLAAARTGVFEVHALDETGSRLLARGSDIRPKSLALVAGKLYWTQGGKRMSATLD